MANNNEKKGVDDRRDFLKKAALSVAAAGTAVVPASRQALTRRWIRLALAIG